MCQKTFLDVLRMASKDGVQRMSQTNYKGESVIKFINKTFKVIDVHYSRSKISICQYLPSELSINKMRRMYNEQAQIP